MRMLVLALGHSLQGEIWPDRVERPVVEHDLFHLLFGFIVLLCMPCLAFWRLWTFLAFWSMSMVSYDVHSDTF